MGSGSQVRRVQTATRTWIGDREYSFHSHVADPRHSVNSSMLGLLTVIVHNGDILKNSNLKENVAEAESCDDVFQRSFLDCVVFLSTSNNPSLQFGEGVEATLRSYGNREIDLLSSDDISPVDLPSGPYVAYEGHIWQPWRIYKDSQSAFVLSLEPYTPHTSSQSSHTRSDVSEMEIVVASRLYSKRTSSRPLSGVRIAVKDAFDINGTKTSLCNRAYNELYPKSNETAPAISRLISKGATIVGKTKLSSLISKEDPTEATDYLAPFNPRGDGYQTPSGSSSGSAAALASYNWLDVAIANGSGRMPAILNGLFGLRLSHGCVDTTSLFAVFNTFDVPSLFARDLKLLAEVVHAWLPDSSAEPSSPDRILWLEDFLPTSNAAQMRLIEDFTSDMESATAVKRINISLAQLWASEPPVEARSESLEQYLDKAGWEPIFFDQYHNLDNFREDYHKQYHRAPYVTRYNRWKWKLGSAVTQEQRDDGIARIKVYRDWLLKTVLRSPECNTILILAVESGHPSYRDAQPKFVLTPQLRNVGQVPYESEVSGRTEQLRVSVSLIGAPGEFLLAPLSGMY
ncbi:MAG: hypothetical protein M1828_007249 [Chrysothrix sp. TS-e1954]|nr:MAG: hypothetical protein M1828_007249 [Chrysothrix sp. TS-e1954]